MCNTCILEEIQEFQGLACEAAGSLVNNTTATLLRQTRMLEKWAEFLL